jgi:cation diffusion facilitator family transporter
MNQSIVAPSPVWLARPDRFGAMQRVLLVVLAANVALAIGIGGFGLWTGSLAMIADGLHALLHALGTLVGLVGVVLAARPPDRSHPYRYERYEPLAALGIVGFMFLAVGEILAQAWGRLVGEPAPAISPWSFVVMSIAIVSTLSLAVWERRRGEDLHSEVWVTDGRRALADVLISISVLVGLVGALLGLPMADVLVSVGIAAMIAWAGWTRLRSLSAILTDATVADIDQIEHAALGVEGVRGVHGVRARGAAGTARIDLHVAVDPDLPTAEAHELTHRVVGRVRAEVGPKCRCMSASTPTRLITPQGRHTTTGAEGDTHQDGRLLRSHLVLEYCARQRATSST